MVTDTDDWRPTKPPLVKHWTRVGVFQIFSYRFLGMNGGYLYLDGKKICPGSTVEALSKMLARGDFDKEFKFSAFDLGIPSHFNDWNGGNPPT